MCVCVCVLGVGGRVCVSVDACGYVRVCVCERVGVCLGVSLWIINIH